MRNANISYMVKTCSCCNLMQAVDQKPDNHLEWPKEMVQGLESVAKQCIEAGFICHVV